MTTDAAKCARDQLCKLIRKALSGAKNFKLR